MNIDFTQSAESIITDLFKDLELATVERKHPFRFCYLATTEVDNVPAQRTVVLRKVLPSKEMLIYTDYRSSKLQEIKQQPQVSILFYHSEKQLQIRFQAIAKIHHQDTRCLIAWNKLNDHNKKDYQIELPPGSDLPNLEEELSHNPSFDSNFFSMISLNPINIDVLQLSRMGHKRLVGQLENGEWIARRVVP